MAGNIPILGFHTIDIPVRPARQYRNGVVEFCKLHVQEWDEYVPLSKYNPFSICSECQQLLVEQEQWERNELLRRISANDHEVKAELHKQLKDRLDNPVQIVLIPYLSS